MAISAHVIRALNLLEPRAIQTATQLLFEFMKYETDELRNEKIILKQDIVNRFVKSDRNTKNIKLSQAKQEFEKFAQLLSELNLANNGKITLEEIKWEKIIHICNILRKIERSDEKKIRWAMLYLLGKNKAEISLKEISKHLLGFDIPNIERTIKKIVKDETKSGLEVVFDDSKLKIITEGKMVEHYFADAIEEQTRRHPGEIEKEILELLDEGSYSNQEISIILQVDEALVSRAMSKLRNQNKLALASFGDRGFRYYTTNCQNCPFGKTETSCRKDALSYIVNAISEDHNIDLSVQDFENIETNQALLQMKRVIIMSRKDHDTKMESNLYENFEKLLGNIVDKSIVFKKLKPNTQSEIQIDSNLQRLPIIYQLGLKAGIKKGIQMTDNVIESLVKDKKDPDITQIRTQTIKETSKILHAFEIKPDT